MANNRKQEDDPLRQVINTVKQTRQREQYRKQIEGDAERNTALPGHQKTEDKKQKKGAWHKSSQDPYMLQKDDRFLDDDNNIRKDADVNPDQQ